MGITGAHITSRNSTGVVGVTRRDRGIAPDDVDGYSKRRAQFVLPQNQELVHILPGPIRSTDRRCAQPSGHARFPTGGRGSRVMGSSTALQNLRKVCRRRYPDR